MQDLNEYLVHLADKLDNEGKLVCANAIDELIQSNSLIKVAQYVGVIGYVLKQNRAMGNCIRKKRASSNQAMQEIVLECLKEYQDGQDYHDTEWHSKYAQVIAEKPNQFNNLHLELIAQWGNNDQLQEHIQKVEDTAILLQENGVKEDTFMQVLSDVEDLGGILRKESSKHPFKLAALPSPRSKWSRFWTPSQFSWKNPMSWMGRWQLGEDKDVMMEMSTILEGITNIGYLTQRMKTNIYRLKNQVAGYMTGSNTDLPDTETPSVINTVSNKIKQLDPSNWNKNLLALQQLRYLLTNSNIQNAYNAEHVHMAINLVDDLMRGVNTVYNHIDDIQKNMMSMRQRNPIKGRDSGLTETGKANPFGMPSPSEEFGVLERVLSRLYENPFDEQTHHYAQRMHARLDDRLRYIQRPQDENIDQWLQNKPEEQEISTVHEPEPELGEDETDSTSPAATSTLSPDQKQEAVKALRDKFTDLPVNQIADILNFISMILTKQGRPDGRLNDITDALLQSTGPNPSTSPINDVPVTTNNPTSPEVAKTEPVATKTEPVATKTEPVATETQPEPVATKAEPSSTKVEEETRGIPTTAIRLESEDDFFNQKDPPTRRDKKNKDMRMASAFDIIRIADALDSVDVELGNLIDTFLEDNEDIMFPLPRFPSVSKVIKEKGVVPSNIQNYEGTM